jgi:type IV pilus assembly protein PilM
MAKKVLSIIIGDEITKVCEVSYRKKYKNKGIRVYKSISFPTPENTIEDGYIKDKNIFGEVLRSQLDVSKMRSKKAIFSIASSKIANREVVLPLVPERKIMNIVKTGASDYFPMDIKDYILSYIILEKKSSYKKEQAIQKEREKQELRQAKLQAKQNKKSNKKNKTQTFNETIPNPRELFKEDGPAQSVELNSAARGKTENTNNKLQKHIRLSVYAVPSSLIKNYYNFANIAGLEVVSVDYSGNSGYQMLKRQSNFGTNVFIQLNEYDTVVSILKDNVLILQRTIGYGISTLMEAVIEQPCFKVANETDALNLLETRDLLNLEDEPPVQINNNWSESEVAATSEFDHSARINSIFNEEYEAKRNIIESLNYLSSSILRMLDYYKNNNKDALIQSIYLSGFGIRIMGIDQLFTKQIGINNDKLEKLATVRARKKARAFRLYPSEFMSCVGAVIKPVDFVPTELVERKEKFRTILGSTFLILLSISGSVLLSYMAFTNYLTVKSEYNVAEERLADMPDTSIVQAEYDKAQSRLTNLQEMEGLTHNNNEKINQVISELEKKLITGTVIHSIQFSETNVVMSISMADDNRGAKALVAKLLLQLKTIELFDTVVDSNMTVSEEGQVSLTVTCSYASNE